MEARIVGDSLVPLLRIVPVTGGIGETVTKIYQKVHYVPIQRKSFQTLEIYIRDDLGKPVPFQRGKSIITLTFRQKRLT